MCRTASSSSAIVTLLLLSLIAACDGPPSHADRRLTADAVLTDVDHLVDTLEQAHADPYRVTSREDLLELVSRVKARLRSREGARISIPESYFILQEIAAVVQDEHTWVAFPHDALPEDELYLPFEIDVVEGKLVTIRSLGKSEIPPFAELLEINGVPARTILERSQDYLSPPLPHAKANEFKDVVYFYLTTLFDLHSPWTVRYASGGAASATASVTAKGIGIRELRSTLSADPLHRAYSMDVNGESIPVLDLPNFSHGSFDDYREFIDAFFESNRGRRALVIDLRRNPGGNGTWGYYMLDHLTDSSYSIIEDFEFKVSDVFRTSGYRDKVGDGLEGARDGEYIPIVMDHTRTPRASSGKFGGQAILLISHFTDSAGVVTAAIFKHAGMGTVVGQETAGRVKFCSDPVHLELPRTGLTVSIPVAIYALPGGSPDRGVIPDIVVDLALADLRQGRDRVMDAVRERLSRSAGSGDRSAAR
jgi:hypothetical protein